MKKIDVGTETTNYKLCVFKSKFNNLELRVFENSKIFWFVANEVAKILEYKQFDNSIARIVEDKNKKYYKDIDFYSSLSSLKNLLPNSILITKDGINNIISRSRSKNVKTFKEWINKDVFPSLKDTEVIQKKEEIQAQFI
jgi:prophage antirepressor-like protein